MEGHTVEDFDQLYATNVPAPFSLVQKLLPMFIPTSSIIMVTSMAVRVVPGDLSVPGAPALPAYAATKGALEIL